jgi:hypothetical protein
MGAYYFQGKNKSSTPYITTLNPGKWDRWREDWVIVHAKFHDRLELPTGARANGTDGGKTG